MSASCHYTVRVSAKFLAIDLTDKNSGKSLKQLFSNSNSCKYYIQQNHFTDEMGRDKRFWYLSPMRAAKVQASLRVRAVSPEPPLLAHTSSEPRGTFRQKARSLAPLNGWTCAVKICHDGMLEDTNSLDGAQITFIFFGTRVHIKN